MKLSKELKEEIIQKITELLERENISIDFENHLREKIRDCNAFHVEYETGGLKRIIINFPPQWEEKKTKGIGITTDPNHPDLKEKKEGSNQNVKYLIHSEEERLKGFVRPLRLSYIHKGVVTKYPLRPLKEEEKERFRGCNYIAFEEYPESEHPSLGRYLTEKQMFGCGTKTTMNSAIAATYARDPKFYGSTFCCRCKKHFPVDEFQWEDGSVVGS